MRIFIFSFFIVLLAQGIAQAQMHFATNDTIKINEVVVTGTQVQVNRNNIPMAVSVVNRSQIEESDESALLPILNGRVPGLFVTERGGYRLWCCCRICRSDFHTRNWRKSYYRSFNAYRRSPAVHGNYGASTTRFVRSFRC